MPSTRLLQIAEHSFLGRLIAKKWDAIADINPNHFYVENVRSLLGVSTRLARFLCDFGVREGVFTKHVEYLCPQCSKSVWSTSVNVLPEGVDLECTNCLLNERDEYEFPVSSFRQLNYYKISDGTKPQKS